MKRENMVWVHTFTIGTNEGRKEMRKVYDSLHAAEAQQEVLGGRVREYVETEGVQVYKVKWPEHLSNAELIESLRQVNSAEVFRDQYMCTPVRQEEPIDIDAVISEIHALVDDVATAAPGNPFSDFFPGSREWVSHKMERVEVVRRMII